MLFGVLPDTIFRPLSNSYRHAYAALLSQLHNGLFGLESTRQPERNEVMGELEEWLLAHIENLPDEERPEFRLTASLAYNEMVECGWLCEQREGWTVYVEMDAVVAQLLGALCGLSERRGDTFGGTVVSVVSNLESVTHDATNAQGVAEAARRAREFARYARGVVGNLKNIEQSLLSQASLNGLVKTFFDNFVQTIVINDYRKLTSARNHPYRHRYRVMDLVARISSDAALFRSIAENLMAQGVADNLESAETALAEQLRDICLSMETIEAFRNRMDLTKGNIERRFSNTMRYMDLIDSGRAERFALGLATVARALPDLPFDAEVPVDTTLFEMPSHIGGERLSKPEKPRVEVKRRRFTKPPVDPLRRAFEHAKQAFDRRLLLTPDQFMDYVRMKVDAARAQGRDEVTAADIPPRDIEEFLIFSALRALPIRRVPLPDGYVIEHRDGTVENDWLICRDFALRRDGGSAAVPKAPNLAA